MSVFDKSHMAYDWNLMKNSIKFTSHNELKELIPRDDAVEIILSNKYNDSILQILDLKKLDKFLPNTNIIISFDNKNTYLKILGKLSKKNSEFLKKFTFKANEISFDIEYPSDKIDGINAECQIVNFRMPYFLVDSSTAKYDYTKYFDVINANIKCKSLVISGGSHIRFRRNCKLDVNQIFYNSSCSDEKYVVNENEKNFDIHKALCIPHIKSLKYIVIEEPYIHFENRPEWLVFVKNGSKLPLEFEEQKFNFYTKILCNDDFKSHIQEMYESAQKGNKIFQEFFDLYDSRKRNSLDEMGIVQWYDVKGWRYCLADNNRMDQIKLRMPLINDHFI